MVDTSQAELGNKTLLQAETEMFQTLIRPLTLDQVDFPEQHWSLSKNDFEIHMMTYSLSGFALELKRNPIPYLTNTYLPTILLTMISFIGFVIPVDIVPGRMALLVTIFLMLVNMNSTERIRGPKVIILNY